MNGQAPLAALMVLEDFTREDVAISLNHEFAKSSPTGDLVFRYYAIEWRASADFDGRGLTLTEDLTHKEIFFFWIQLKLYAVESSSALRDKSQDADSGNLHVHSYAD
ncbi:unnamed protein product [marine sediment metagenome]|uniref:Uncharacterized protein n=1 Tax=marine sediment metagenome TaxID=412755 RepID=X0SUZ5_9ZZZZ